MKRFFFLFAIVALSLFSCKNETSGYLIKADIDGANGMTFKLMVVEDNSLAPIDSAVSKNGSFTMKGSVDYPRIVYLLSDNSSYRTSFFLENSEVSISGSLDAFDELTISGSSIQNEYLTLTEDLQPLSASLDNIENLYQDAVAQGDAALVEQYDEAYEDIVAQITDLQKTYVRYNPSSFLVPEILSGISYDLEAGELTELLSGLSPELSAIPEIVSLNEMAKKMMSVSVGQKAPDFTLNDVDGNPVSLYSKLGPKLLLVDFWASWCNPCRQENPNVVKVYSEFNKKGFDVFGVSLDKTKADWEKAIKDDKLTWTHVSDLNYWNNAAAKLYSVNAIPCNFLLDEEGVIVARNLRGKDLYNFVSEKLK